MTTSNAEHQRAYRKRQKLRATVMRDALVTIADATAASTTVKGKLVHKIATEALAEPTDIAGMARATLAKLAAS